MNADRARTILNSLLPVCICVHLRLKKSLLAVPLRQRCDARDSEKSKCGRLGDRNIVEIRIRRRASAGLLILESEAEDWIAVHQIPRLRDRLAINLSRGGDAEGRRAR